MVVLAGMDFRRSSMVGTPHNRVTEEEGIRSNKVMVDIHRSSRATVDTPPNRGMEAVGIRSKVTEVVGTVVRHRGVVAGGWAQVGRRRWGLEGGCWGGWC